MRRAYSASVTACASGRSPVPRRAGGEEQTTSAANAAGRTATGQGAGVSTRSARVTGQAATQDRQPKHSSERTRQSRSTGRREGQAFVHRPQSMQEGAWRVTFSGERSDTAPRRAPYGHR